MISMILAMDRNRLIGKDNKLPWHIPGDLAYFRKVTTGHTVIMGRKTYESIGKPLPGRKNVVITHRDDFHPEGCTICRSIEEAADMGRGEEVFVIGGAQVYTAFLPLADRLYITHIDESFEGDTWFPDIDPEEWKLVSNIQGSRDEKNPYTCWFAVYTRKGDTSAE
jgi:dihydrofolate reductase